MSENDLFEFEPLAESGRARLSVNPAVRSPHAVNPLLYGKFCEHLGSNIYQGMEAQILYNPTFGKLKVGEEFFTHAADRFGWPDGAAAAEAHADGAAVGWVRVGAKDEVLLSPDAGPHDCQAQRFETPAASKRKPKGIGQWTYLPLRRTRGHEFRVVARAQQPCRIELSLAPVDPTGKAGRKVARATIDLTSEWATFTGRLDVAADADVAEGGAFLFSVTAEEPANVVLDRVLLYPDDHVHHADPDVIAMLKEARLPILRWPGGNFVSGYDWRDGAGPVDARPTKPNPAWGGCLEPNLFGTDEFIVYCRDVGCEPMICINAGDGTPEQAAAWVEYCNGGAETPMGRLRAESGHGEPHAVKYWEIGNELFGRHQIGWTTPAGYVDRYMRFSRAMWAVDPAIRILACGGLHLGVDAEWNRRLIAETDGTATCHTHHILEGGAVDEDADPKELFGAFMGYPIRVGRDYQLMRRRMLDAGIAEPRLAITELQLFAHVRGPHHHGRERRPAIPNPATISEALYLTLIVHECIRLGELVEMITHSATLNHGGGLRKAREKVWANPVHYAHVMGVELAGGTPVGVRLACGTFSTTREFGHLPVVEAAPDLDAMAVLAEDERSLLLMLVHRSAGAGPIELSIDLGGFPAGAEAETLTLAGETLDDQNTFEKPERIAPRPSSAAIEGGKLALTLRPYSLTRVRIPAR